MALVLPLFQNMGRRGVPVLAVMLHGIRTCEKSFVLPGPLLLSLPAILLALVSLFRLRRSDNVRITLIQEVSTTLDLLEMVCVNTLKNPLLNFDNNENIVKARSMNTALEEELRGLMVE